MKLHQMFVISIGQDCVKCIRSFGNGQMDENGTNWRSLKSSTIDQPEIVEKMEYGKMVFKMAENGITLGKRNLTNVS